MNRRDSLPYGLKPCAEVRRIWYTRDDEMPLLDPSLAPDLSVDGLVDDGAGETALMYRELAATALGVMTPREAKVVQMRYMMDMTFEEVACVFGVTRERIRQIELKAFRRVRLIDAGLDADLA